MPDEYTREEIRDAVWQATLGVPCDAIARGWGRHSASSVYMMLLGMAGTKGSPIPRLDGQGGGRTRRRGAVHGLARGHPKPRPSDTLGFGMEAGSSDGNARLGRMASIDRLMTHGLGPRASK